ncbi:MAG: hypothetical protein ACKVZ0_17190 [Gemmatimonadales bacterium]
MGSGALEADGQSSQKARRARFKSARKRIADLILGKSTSTDVDIAGEFGLSRDVLGEYVTLDWAHCQDITAFTEAVRAYSTDQSRRRPLNLMMQAEPGSGKSHFIKCVARAMAKEGIKEVTFNMSSLQGIDDFIHPLEAVRNLKVIDRLPLLFLDEFDSDDRHFATLLPLLWDGELNVRSRQLQIGKAVIVLAGSGARIAALMQAASGMHPGPVAGDSKLTDLLSRINGGVLTIPGLDELNGERNRRVDKVCLTLSLLQQRFGSSLIRAPWGFLTFIANTEFRYGVRSIAHLIDLLPARVAGSNSLTKTDLTLPFESLSALKASSLAYHVVVEDGPASLVEAWKRAMTAEATVSFDRPKLSWLARLREGDRAAKRRTPGAQYTHGARKD